MPSALVNREPLQPCTGRAAKRCLPGKWEWKHSCLWCILETLGEGMEDSLHAGYLFAMCESLAKVHLFYSRGHSVEGNLSWHICVF